MVPPPERPGFESGAAALAEAIARLAEEDAVSLPLLSQNTLRELIEETGTFAYRPATPVIGEGEKRVMQDCEVSCAVSWDGPLAACAGHLQSDLQAALALLSPHPLPERFCINDLIVQRYPKGSGGITPHRDHLAYRGLISVITLSGTCRFAVCRDRSGADARTVPAPPGWLVLMRGPGLFGLNDRPFHFVDRFSEPRISIGLRHDRRATDGSVATLGLGPGG